MAQRYREEVTGFSDALNDAKHGPEAAHLTGLLIREIVITPHNDSKRVVVDGSPGRSQLALLFEAKGVEIQKAPRLTL